MVPRARRTLEAGFTTVRELGDSHNASVALRDAIAAGHVVGPRIFTAAKSIATTDQLSGGRVTVGCGAGWMR